MNYFAYIVIAAVATFWLFRLFNAIRGIGQERPEEPVLPGTNRYFLLNMEKFHDPAGVRLGMKLKRIAQWLAFMVLLSAAFAVWAMSTKGFHGLWLVPFFTFIAASLGAAIYGGRRIRHGSLGTAQTPDPEVTAMLRQFVDKGKPRRRDSGQIKPLVNELLDSLWHASAETQEAVDFFMSTRQYGPKSFGPAFRWAAQELVETLQPSLEAEEAERTMRRGLAGIRYIDHDRGELGGWVRRLESGAATAGSQYPPRLADLASTRFPHLALHLEAAGRPGQDLDAAKGSPETSDPDLTALLRRLGRFTLGLGDEKPLVLELVDRHLHGTDEIREAIEGFLVGRQIGWYLKSIAVDMSNELHPQASLEHIEKSIRRGLTALTLAKFEPKHLAFWVRHYQIQCRKAGAEFEQTCIDTARSFFAQQPAFETAS